MHGSIPRTFFSKEEASRISEAIRQAEQGTSGEIRVHLARRLRGDILEESKVLFERLGMTQTKGRNGVLFVLELKQHKFAVLGDKGIDEKVSADFWREIRDIVLEHFRERRFATGLSEGIRRCGEQLRQYFPLEPGDRNELSDKISVD